MTETWYSPRDVIFDRDQVLFLIQHSNLLREGIWPPEPKETGYIDSPVQRSPSPHAHFETPCQVIAEIECRLSKTGIEGKLLVAEIESGKEFEELAFESKRALSYCSGWQRRRQSYQEWLKKRKYRRKVVPRSTHTP